MLPVRLIFRQQMQFTKPPDMDEDLYHDVTYCSPDALRQIVVSQHSEIKQLSRENARLQAKLDDCNMLMHMMKERHALEQQNTISRLRREREHQPPTTPRVKSVIKREREDEPFLPCDDPTASSSLFKPASYWKYKTEPLPIFKKKW